MSDGPANQRTDRSVPSHPLRYIARHTRWIVAGIVALVFTNALAKTAPYIVKLTVDAIASVAKHGDTPAGRQRIALWALLVFGLAVGAAITRILSRVFIFNAGREAEYELRRSLFSHLCRLDGTFYRRYRVGDLMSRLTNDLSSVRVLFGFGVLQITNTVFAYAIGLPLMLRIDAGLTLWSMLPYPVLLFGARFFSRGIYGRSRDLQAALASMTAAVQEDLAGIREIKSYQLEQRRAEIFSTSSRTYLDQAMRLSAWRAGMMPFVGSGAGASLVLVLWLGGNKVMRGEMSLGDLVALNLYIAQLAWPTMAIGWLLSLWQRGVAAWHRLRELLAQEPEVAVTEVDPVTLIASGDAAHEEGEAPPSMELEVTGLTLRLGDTEADDTPPGSPAPVPAENEGEKTARRDEVLRDVSFTMAEGSLNAVVGRVGAGKTTLAEAVARLLPVPPGAVFFGGRDVCELSVRAVRQRIAYAPQDAFLFSATIRENVAFGLPLDTPEDQRDARVREAVKAAGLTSDLEQLADGLETVVGERGISLSGGQRQRVALARALAARRPFLILDDSLSAVDAETELEIIEGLRSMLEDTTTLLISHRLSALQHADQIVVLADDGAVAERGTHAELIAAGGEYAALYQRQVLDADMAALGGADAGESASDEVQP